MFISSLEIFKIGIGPSSSHTMGPMVAAKDFTTKIAHLIADKNYQNKNLKVICTLKDSLAFTGRGHCTDTGIILGLNGLSPSDASKYDIEKLVKKFKSQGYIEINSKKIAFDFDEDIIFDTKNSYNAHPNGVKFELCENKHILLKQIYFSIGGGFISTLEEINKKNTADSSIVKTQFGFDSADSMMKLAIYNNISVAQLKLKNELEHHSLKYINTGLDKIIDSMFKCVENGLSSEGILPGKLGVQKRAKKLYQKKCINCKNSC